MLVHRLHDDILQIKDSAFLPIPYRFLIQLQLEVADMHAVVVSESFLILAHSFNSLSIDN